MSPMVYCLEHMEEIARRKSSARTLCRGWPSQPQVGLPAREATTTGSRRSALTRPGARISPQPSSGMLSLSAVIDSIGAPAVPHRVS